MRKPLSIFSFNLNNKLKGRKIPAPIVESVLTLIFLALMVRVLSLLVENKQSYGKYNEFYKYSGEYEVLFCGSSHMMNAVLPMELWKDYGIHSYNIGNGAETIPVTYHVVLNALDYAAPEVLVMDVFYAYSDQILPEISKEMPHQFFDLLPLSENKLRSVREIFRDEKDRWNYIIPFSIYHSRWNELTKNDLRREDECLGGARLLLASYTLRDTLFDPPASHDIPGRPREYIKKVKELCDERGIRLICVVNPYAMWQENRTCNVNFKKEMAELGIEFLDLREDVVDIYADSADDMHVNLCGERKVTDFYGRYLSSILPRRDSSYSSDSREIVWNERYAAYVQKKEDFLAMCEDAAPLLSDLNDPDFYFEISMRSDTVPDDTMLRMLENAKNYDNVSIMTDDDMKESLKIRIRRKDSEEYFVNRSF